MNLPQDVQKFIDHIVDSAIKTIPVTKIYLFGSYAKGNYNKHSDIDIFIVTPDKSKRTLDMENDIRDAIGFPKFKPLDIVVNYEDEFEIRSKLISALEKQIFETGVIVYAS